MATIKDVAARSGFSPSTVSYALRDNPRIPEQTRDRIKAIAAELGYQRDAHLGQLMAHLKSRRHQSQACPIAWLNSASNPGHWRDTPWAREFYESAAQRAREQGFALNEIWVHDQRVPYPRLDEVMKARGTRGLVLSTPLRNQEWVHWIDWDSYAVVVLDDPDALPQFDHVYALYCSNMRMALEQVFQRGYRRPKLWLSEEDDYWTAYGYTNECLRQNRLRPDVAPILTPPAPDISPATVHAWMETHQPDAIIAPTATLGRQLVELGYRIPQDIGYVAMYVLNDDAHWSGVSQLHHQQSIIAIDRLASLLQMNTLGRRPHPQHIQIKGRWREGSTLREPEFEPVRTDR